MLVQSPVNTFRHTNGAEKMICDTLSQSKTVVQSLENSTISLFRSNISERIDRNQVVVFISNLSRRLYLSEFLKKLIFLLVWNKYLFRKVFNFYREIRQTMKTKQQFKHLKKIQTPDNQQQQQQQLQSCR